MDKKLVIDIFETDKPNVCFVGDIHGNFEALKGLMKKTGFRDTVYIVCGDIGLGFHKKEYYSQIFNKLSRTASKLNCEFMFIRGNHDEKKYFDKQLIHRKCFKTIPDYSVIKAPSHSILCIGGAISIDRGYRKEKFEKQAEAISEYNNISLNEAKKIADVLYWDDEPCYFDEEKLSQLKLNNINIDIVCTHTCPSFVKPFGKIGIEYWLDKDKMLSADIDNERAVMDSVYNKLKDEGHEMKLWIYGHFHFHNTDYIGNTKFVMLDMCRNHNCDIYDIMA